ncbi:unnamed protein product [Periconia digitata]|uniref:Secreted protein n=1 Tax=Periconia digitata TaxID=1303443 RepID=A0A9W4XMB3_9PLEO|nr:unnamed protein product [Periconia digitata]
MEIAWDFFFFCTLWRLRSGAGSTVAYFIDDRRLHSGIRRCCSFKLRFKFVEDINGSLLRRRVVTCSTSLPTARCVCGDHGI